MSHISQPERLPAENLPQSRLIPVNEVPKKRRLYGSKGVVGSTGGRVVTPAGVFSHVIDVDGNPESIGHHTLAEDDVNSSMQGIEKSGAITYAETGDRTEVLRDAAEIEAESKRADKKQRQWRKWSEDIIPTLLQPYMSLMRETESLRHIDSVRGRKGCQGCVAGRLIDVSCVYFNSKF